MTKRDRAFAEARKVAERCAAPSQVTELVLGSESVDPAGRLHIIVRAWTADHQVFFISVRFQGEALVHADLLRLPGIAPEETLERR